VGFTLEFRLSGDWYCDSVNDFRLSAKNQRDSKNRHFARFSAILPQFGGFAKGLILCNGIPADCRKAWEIEKCGFPPKTATPVLEKLNLFFAQIGRALILCGR
jgi:hypothetical protein